MSDKHFNLRWTICFIRTIIATCKNWRGLMDFGAFTSGHEFEERPPSKIEGDKILSYLVCKTCGKIEECWEQF